VTVSSRPPSRRDLLAAAWFPFFRPRHIALGGARFRILRNGRSPRRYLVIHGNEETARAVLERHMRNHDGIAYIVEGHTRNVLVEGLVLDPNRMFSRAGAEASLRRLNAGVGEAALSRALNRLERGRERLVRALTPPRAGLCFALHNNSEGYSVESEIPISDRTSIREPRNPHAFFLCTDAGDFERLATSPYNVVLQQKAPSSDDGSLSRLAAKRGFRYVNLEVALGQTDRQREMVAWLEWNLPVG
jgi:hypothetical protein